MKKEINVWVDKSIVHGTSYRDTRAITTVDPELTSFLKATLIIEKPEPRIEVTPSQIREACRKADKIGLPFEEMYDNLIKELFGEGE